MAPNDSAGEVEACLVLVDYDNAFPPNTERSDEEIATEVDRWLRDIADQFPSLSYFDVRLYGGWYDDQDLSRHGSEAARIVATLTQFPLKGPGGRIFRGKISLASAPLATKSEGPLLGTYRRRGSLPRVRLSRHPYPEDCAHADDHCPAAILRSFTKHRSRECPAAACSLVAGEAFVAHEQKMVDTMLATDLLTANLQHATYQAVVVVSGDSDFVPPLLAANTIGGIQLMQLRPRVEEASTGATSVLIDAGIRVI